MKNGMYVVDAHAHPPRKGIAGLDSRPYLQPETPEEVDALFETDLQEVVREMDEQGVDAKILLSMPEDIEAAFHFGEALPKNSGRTLTSLQWTERAMLRHPDRFFGIACLNPTQPDACDRLEALVCDQGFIGAKIHQAHIGLEVDDDLLSPFYRTCIRLEVPVLFHTGFAPDRSIDRLIPTNPLRLDELAWKFPSLKIVMCHTGGHWYQEAVQVLLRNPNIMTDIAAYNCTCETMVFPICSCGTLIARIAAIIGSDRMMFGTDNLIRDMNPDVVVQSSVSSMDAEKILGLNAKHFFKLDEKVGY